MRKLLLILFLLILTGTSGFCQTIYPRKIVFEGDTLVAITGEQLVKINLAIAGERRYHAENEVLQREVQVSDSLAQRWQQITALQDSVIFSLHEQIDLSEKLNLEAEGLLRQQKKKNLKTTIGVGVGGILLGVITGLLLVK